MNTRKPLTEYYLCGFPIRRDIDCRTAVSVVRVAAVILLMLLGIEKLSANQPAGPVLHYTFDTRVGNTVENKAGDHHPGRSIGALFQGRGAVGRALVVWKDKPQFGYVETADHEDLNSPKFTVAA